MATRRASIALDADVSGFRSGMRKAAGATDGVRQGLSGVGSMAKQAAAGFASIVSAAAGLAAVRGSLAATRAAIGFVVESLEGADKQKVAERQLESILQNQRKSGLKIAKDMAATLMVQASTLQEMTTLGDEDIIKGQAQLASFKALIPHMREATELLVRMGEKGTDPISAANMLGKAAGGRFGELQRIGIDISKGAKEAFKDGASLDQILEEIGQQLPKLGISASTAAGRLKQMSNQFGDLKEQIGDAFTPAIKQAVATLRPMLGQLQDWVNNNSGAITKRISEVAQLIVGRLADIGARLVAFAKSGGIRKTILGFKIIGATVTFVGQAFETFIAGGRVGFSYLTESIVKLVGWIQGKLFDAIAAAAQKFSKLSAFAEAAGVISKETLSSIQDGANALTLRAGQGKQASLVYSQAAEATRREQLAALGKSSRAQGRQGDVIAALTGEFNSIDVSIGPDPAALRSFGDAARRAMEGASAEGFQRGIEEAAKHAEAEAKAREAAAEKARADAEAARKAAAEAAAAAAKKEAETAAEIARLKADVEWNLKRLERKRQEGASPEVLAFLQTQVKTAQTRLSGLTK